MLTYSVLCLLGMVTASLGAVAATPQVAAGYQFSLAALGADGKIVSSGRNDYGQLGNGELGDGSKLSKSHLVAVQGIV